jgi:hypothetical protein
MSFETAMKNALAALPINPQIGDSEYYAIDADTLKSSVTGELFRQKGIRAPETGKSVFVAAGADFKNNPQQGGLEAYKQYTDLARAKGFTEPIISDEVSSDEGKRKIVDIRNPDTGELWSEYLLSTGLQSPTGYSSQRELNIYREGVYDRLQVGASSDPEAARARRIVQEAKFEGVDRIVKGTAANIYDFRASPESYSGIAYLARGTNYDGSAKNQQAVAFDNALIGNGASWYGFVQAMGNMLGDEEMVYRAEVSEAYSNFKIGLNPTTIVDLAEIEGFHDTINWMGNMGAMTLPFMFVSIGGALAGSAVAPVVGTAAALAISLLGPAALMSGQVYNEQEDDHKNVTAALTSGLIQASFERLGLRALGVIPGLKGADLGVFTANTAKRLATEKGISLDAARQIVMNSNRRSLSDLFEESAAFAKSHLTARELSRSVVTKFAGSATVESATEVAQEVVAQIGANTEKAGFGIIKEGVFQSEFLNRIMNAAAAGGVVGGAIGGVGGGLVDAGAWANVSHDLAVGDKQATMADRLDKDTDDLSIKEYMSEQDFSDIAPDVMPIRVEEHRDTLKNRTATEVAAELITVGTVKLFAGQGKNKRGYTNEMGMKYPSLLRMANGFLDILNRNFSGPNYEGFIMKTSAMLDTRLNVGEYTKGYGGILRDEKAAKLFNRDFYKIADDYLKHHEFNLAKKIKNEKNPFDWSKYTALQQKVIKPLIEANGEFEDGHLQKLSETARDMQNEAWNAKGLEEQTKFKKKDLYLLRFRAVDKNRAIKKRKEFGKAIADSYGVSMAIALDVVDLITGDGDVTSVSSDKDAFDMMTNGILPSATKKRTMALSENPDLADFYFQDLGKNIREFNKSAARFISYNTYVGRGGVKLEHLAREAAKEGAPEEVINSTMNAVHNIVQSQSGNYKRPKNGTAAADVLLKLKHASLITLFVGLPLSMLASFPEMAMTVLGLSRKEIFGKKGLANIGRNMMDTFYDVLFMTTAEWWTGHEHITKSEQRRVNKTLGFGLRETGAATVTGAESVSDIQNVWVTNFFKYNGTAPFTDLTRNIRVGFAADFMTGKLQILLAQKYSGRTDPDTNEQRNARSQLRNLGMAVDRYMDLINEDGTFREPLTDAEQEFKADQEQTVMYNWVNDSVPLPGAANRPLWYLDPRFALLTQFNGFIATFTSHHIPRMWGDYVKRGRPSIKYNTFAVMVTMIMLGYASQYLKDLIKYGKGGNPYLEDNQKIRRAINSSGMLGTSERIMDLAHPLYPQRSGGPIGWIANAVQGNVPALGPVTNLLSGVGNLLSGNREEGIYDIAGATPLIAPMTSIKKLVSGKD